ncbi:transcriptional regulator with XRE-family HTH domain [Kribbella voronezhensis]|uniref:Transcriptional regulator with XRE-family HTH domain n=1 Tax=Kribbella voronezhensis TaxID=2512212 RepID=A0A4R7TDA8_9ACTN|nr:helix-turn-helix transcriptional regulator [Kribbella voronezhensis]TDU89486.1 transcriptional regulator with XRE-family HTH domain [Kribbella voronezhensis]
MDELELGSALRARRKAADRTIASVAVDAGLSVPYIANLENGRGNPTLAALDRLSTALGATLTVSLNDTSIPATSNDAIAALLDASPRATQVIRHLAATHATTRPPVRAHLIATLEAMTPLLPTTPTEPDLHRLLDLLLLAN